MRTLTVWVASLMLIAGLSYGQAISGNIVGTVVDSSGAAVPSATVANAEDEADTLQATLDRAATVRIKAALDSAGGNRNDAATMLGVDRTTLYRLMKRLGL